MSITAPPIDDWPERKVRLRRWLSRRVPTPMIEYPFECYLSVAALLVGIPVLLGFSRPGSFVELVPQLALLMWAVSLVLGAITVGIALWKKHAGALASGEQLLGVAMITYGVATLISVGFTSAAAVSALFLLAGTLSFLRSLYFRRLIDIQIGARRLSRPT